MSRKSSSKQNLNSSYYDLTSPLSNLQKVKQKNLLRTSIQNSFLGKVHMYSQNSTKNLQKSSSKSDTNYISLKAGSQVYKLPEFTVPEINYEISQAIKQKTGQIKEDMVAHLPAILGSSHSLPSLVPKSSNFNPKKLENIFGHRSSILELETWIKNSLAQGLPTSPQHLIEYKQMIMGVGMKELIRIINLRCLEEGKLLEQVWELTWGICKEIIQHMALRARKCEEILTQQLIEFNQGCKRNYFEKDKELIQLRNKVKECEEQNSDLNDKLEELTKQNQRISIENSKNFLNNTYVSEEFLNVLEENLAMYLHLGDKNKKDWIRKMYKQVSRSRDSIKNSLKEKVNQTVTARIQHEESFGEQDAKDIQMDEEGNFIIESEKVIKQNGQIVEKQENQDCNQLVNQLGKQFELKEASVQTDIIQMIESEIQYQGPAFEEKQVATDSSLYEEIGVNTEVETEKDTKIKDGKNKKQKVPPPKPLKSKLSKRSSLFTDTIESKQSISPSPLLEAQLIKGNPSEDDSKKQVIQIIEYVCKECNTKKSKEDALFEIQFEEEQQRMRRQQSESKKYDKNNQNDSQNERSFLRKNPSKKRTHMSPISPKQSFRDENSSEKSPQKQEKSRVKRMLSNIEEHKIVEDPSEIESQIGRFGGENSDIFPQYSIDLPNPTQIKRKYQRRDSGLLHDISVKKEIEQSSYIKEAAYNMIKSEQDEKDMVARLPLSSKEPYFKFFTEQITEANKDLINEITYQQSNNETILNNYFNIVQEVNAVPESRIQLSEKQMLTTIEKNLMPIILELLNTVKKSVLKKTVDQTIRTFSSLPFILMNKFSTKYGVKILAIKNMKLLLSSLKKIELTTDRYKSIRLMLFTDCRAMYSEDLFVYLLVLAIITPHLDIEKAISYQEVNEIRQICEKYLTTQKRVYEEFDIMTKEAFSLNVNQQKIENLKLAPLLRSIITSYRMIKINRIEEVGFLFLMLKKQNYVEYLTFSYFLSCFKIETEIKVKIVKTFLANCDLRAKNKRIAISESGFSRFLIRCPEFNFETLNQAISKQRNEISRHPSVSSTKKMIPSDHRMSEQVSSKHQSSINDIKSFASLKNEDEIIVSKNSGSVQMFESKYSTEKAILMASQLSLTRNILTVEQKIVTEKIESNRKDQNQQLKLEQGENAQIGETQQMIIRNSRRQFSLNEINDLSGSKSQISEKMKQYSYFTYEISKFMENEEQTKYMTLAQKKFVSNYLVVHVMACEVEEIIGLIDYFSNDMLEIVCCDINDLKVGN